MLYIMNRDLQVVTVANNIGQAMPYYNDNHIETLTAGTSSYEFTIPSNHPDAQFVVEGNYVVRNGLDGEKLMFTIMNVEESHSDISEKVIYCEDAGMELINEIEVPYTETTAHDITYYINRAISDTDWVVGYCDITATKTLSYDQYETVLARLLKIASDFDIELSFSVEMTGSMVTHKYVNIHQQRGNDNGKRFTYTKDITSIRRKVDMAEVCTSLLGIGKTDDKGVTTTFSSLTYDDGDIYTTSGSQYLYSRSALDNWGQQGGNINRVFQYDTSDANELMNRAITELKNRINPSVTYEVDVVLLEMLVGSKEDKVRIGDTVRVIDATFPTPLLLEARIMELEISYTDPTKDKTTLGNYTIVKSDISPQLLALQSTLMQKEATWDSASSNASTALSTANSAQADATTALSTLTDIASDNKFSPSEKQATTKEWNIITSEKTTIDAQASTYSTITTEKTNYDNAYTTLSNYITPLLADITTTSDIVGTDFRSNFKAYYDAKTTLLKKISDTAKSLADSAQTTANSKAKTFTSQPVPPYSVGDIWTQGSTGDVMNCATARASGSYTASDWVKSSKYTDDTTANTKAKTFIATPTVPYSLGDIYKNGQTTYICTTARATGSYTTTDWTLTGDVTANNTSADTSKVNGTASSTIVTYATNGNSAYNDTTGWKVAGKTTIDGANIETGTIIWDKAKGGTLSLGGSSNGNGQLVLFDANGNQIANLDSSTGGFSNLYVADLDSPTVPSYSDQDLSFYVAANSDSANGISTPDDNNLGNGWASPLQTISEAIRRIPKVYDGNVTIWLAYGQTFYEAGIKISGFSGSGTITIDGQYKTGTKLNGSIIVSNCSLWTVIKNFTLNSNNTDYGIKYDGMSRGQVNTMLVNGIASNGTTYGFVAFNGAYAEAISSEFYSCQRAVGGSYGGQAFIQNCKGYGSVAGVTSWAGHLHGTGTAPSGAATTNTAYGGAITATFTYDAGAYTVPTPPPTVATWTSTGSDSFTDGAMVWDNTTNDPLQGKYGSAGNYRGLWFFGTAPSTAVTGKTIKQIRVYLTRQNNSGSSGSINAVIRPHGYTSVPTGQPAYLSASYTVGFKYGEGKWVNLPSSFYSLFSGGSAKGIMIYTTNTADYMRFSGYAKLEITYS